jgi:DNA-binding NtrC family response regulator
MQPPIRDFLTIRVREDLECAVRSHVRVLITGGAIADSARLAQWIHDHGPRRSGRFVSIDCAAPQMILQSGMPDPGRGPYPTHAGTLFINNVGEMNARMQSELVRVIDHAPAEPIIAATSGNLHDEVLAGRFREDLYYRLNIIHIVFAGTDTD